MPIRCKSSPGFVVNRALLPYINKGVAAMLDGANADEIDQALVNFGMPMGPIELADQIGLDVMLDASLPLGPESLPENVAAEYKRMIDQNTIGRKIWPGLYEWDDKKAHPSQRRLSSKSAGRSCATVAPTYRIIAKLLFQKVLSKMLMTSMQP